MRVTQWSAALVAAAAVTTGAQAEIQTFILEWSGASFGNSATANGMISIDFNELSNPGSNSTIDTPFVTDFLIAVTGSTSGDGVWDLGDYNEIILNTNAETDGGPTEGVHPALDFSQELIGQPTAVDPWGTSQPGGTGGDFNIFAGDVFGAPTGTGPDDGTPHGTYFFEITVGSFDDATGEGGPGGPGGPFGERLLLTSFRPIPTPGTAAICTLAAASLGTRRRR